MHKKSIDTFCAQFRYMTAIILLYNKSVIQVELYFEFVGHNAQTDADCCALCPGGEKITKTDKFMKNGE